MRRSVIPILPAALLVAVVLAVAGCGGGGKKKAATTTVTETTASATTEAATTEAATTEAATTEAATTEAATTEAATTEAATTTSTLSGLASSKDCRELADLQKKYSDAFSGAAGGEDLKKQAKLIKEFADKTPEDIRPDFQVFADYFAKVAEVAGDLKAGSTPDPATLAKLQKLATEVDQEKLAQASSRVAAWVQKNCAS